MTDTYTPDELAMRSAHKFHVRALDSAQCGAPGHAPMTDGAITAEFDRFIDKVRADALRAAADEYATSNREQAHGATSVLMFMHHRADRIEEDGR